MGLGMLSGFVLGARLASPLILSLVVVACGFALNASAVMALGSKRTYYGFELDALPPVHVTRFPYSVTAHPMLLGNLIGFGGTLLDPAFRQDWWPLAVLHLVGNGTVLVMEARGKPPSVHWPLGGLLATALLIALHSPAGGPAAVGWFVLCTAFGLVVIATYARRPREGRSPTVPHHA